MQSLPYFRRHLQFVDRITEPENSFANQINRYDERATKLADQLRFGDDDIASLQPCIDILYADMSATFDQLGESSSVDMLELYRFNDRLEMLDQRVKTAYAFARHDRVELREQLVDGNYGINAYAIRSALEAFDSSSGKSLERRKLQGVLNELTPVALIHRVNSPSEMAYLSDLADDEIHKTDINYHLMRGEQPHRYNIQSKSSRNFVHKVQATEEPVFNIFAEDFKNHTSVTGEMFPTSRLIVKDIEGTINQKEENRLNKVNSTFLHRLHNITNKQ